jgi:hypothetical protein
LFNKDRPRLKNSSESNHLEEEQSPLVIQAELLANLGKCLAWRTPEKQIKLAGL